MKNINFEPIGYVKTDAVGEQLKDKKTISQIIIKEQFSSGLVGIEDFSHLFVLFYLNQISKQQREILMVHPRGRTGLPLMGVFAVRTMFRPNPIGLTLVELIKVESNVLTVEGLDALDKTPVLDVKPYDHWDTVKNIRVPDWWMKLEEERNILKEA